MTVRQKREALTRLPPDLEDEFDEAQTRIKMKGRERVQLGLAALAWISTVTRALTVVESLEALSIEPCGCDNDPTNRATPKDVFECCAGLVEIEGLSNTVHFTHFRRCNG